MDSKKENIASKNPVIPSVATILGGGAKLNNSNGFHRIYEKCMNFLWKPKKEICHCEEHASATWQSKKRRITKSTQNGLPRSRWSLAMTKGFTLAEVLITLSILGIIAAIIIPNLTNNFKKRQTEVGLLRAYTMLQKAIDVSQAINGPTATWPLVGNGGSMSVKNFSENYILPYLPPVSYKCDAYGNNGNYADYLDNATHSKHCFKPGIKNVRGELWGQGRCHLCGYSGPSVYRLKNGMSLGIGDGLYIGITFIFDIDGPDKGKNQVGADIFMFKMGKGSSNPSLSTGFKWKDNEIIIDCGPNPTKIEQAEFGVPGQECTKRIEKNGWKIPKDYPIKRF